MNGFGLPELPRSLELVDVKLKESTRASSPALQAAVSRFLNAKGKRLRPTLVIAIAINSGYGVDDKIICAASAIELVHMGSLVHDDIMDEGKLRWGIPTINSLEGVNAAVLVGDYLFATGCALAASISAPAGQLLATTITKLCDGQSLEMADQFNIERTEASLLSAIRGKTSVMFSAACQLGGLSVGLTKADLVALDEYGKNFGLAFQILDDVLDFSATSEVTGKSIGNDVREGTYTLPVLLSLAGKQRVALKKILKSKQATNMDVLQILKTDGSLNASLQRAKVYIDKAYLAVSGLQEPRVASFLAHFTNRYFDSGQVSNLG